MSCQPKHQATIGELVEPLVVGRKPIPWDERSEARALSLIAQHRGIGIGEVRGPHLTRQISALREWVAREAGMVVLPCPDMTYEGGRWRTVSR